MNNRIVTLSSIITPNNWNNIMFSPEKDKASIHAKNSIDVKYIDF